MSSILALRRPADARDAPPALLVVAMAAAVAAGSVVVLHSDFALSRPDAVGRDTLGVLAAILTAMPLIAWRRHPLTAFVVTAAASVAMAAIGYPIGLPFAPAVALYALAAGRTREAPWTSPKTATVLSLFIAYLAAAALTESSLPLGGLPCGLPLVGRLVRRRANAAAARAHRGVQTRCASRASVGRRRGAGAHRS